jgi:hypothetical protein
VEYLVPKFFEQKAPGKWMAKRRNATWPHEGEGGYASFFYAVIGDRFNPAEQGRSSEPVAAPHPTNRATREEMDRGINALEASA